MIEVYGIIALATVLTLKCTTYGNGETFFAKATTLIDII